LISVDQSTRFLLETNLRGTFKMILQEVSKTDQTQFQSHSTIAKRLMWWPSSATDQSGELRPPQGAAIQLPESLPARKREEFVDQHFDCSDQRPRFHS
jgi:hypothetical protein